LEIELNKLKNEEGAVRVSSKEVSPEKEQQAEDSLLVKLPSIVRQQEENNYRKY
jgi:hypothetical protein